MDITLAQRGRSFARIVTTFHDVDEGEIRAMLGETAIDVFGFDRGLMEETAARIGPQIADIQQAPAA